MINKIEVLINKVGKIWLWVFLAVVVYAVISSAFDNRPESVKNAKTDLFIAYRDNIYDTAKCDTKEIKDTWVILCHPEGKAIGGLFEVVGDGDNYLLYSLNGKAQSHTSKIGFEVPINSSSKIATADVMKLFKDDIEG